MRIIRELRIVIVLKFLMGFSVVTVKSKFTNFSTPRHSIFLQILIILFHVYILYVCSSLVKFPSFSYAEDLLILLRRLSLFLISILIFIECLLNRKNEINYWNNLSKIDKILRKEFHVFVRFKRFLCVSLLAVFILCISMWQCFSHIFMEPESAIFVVEFLIQFMVFLYSFKSFYFIMHAALILVQ